jgi:hypothetical protein
MRMNSLQKTVNGAESAAMLDRWRKSRHAPFTASAEKEICL